jgi:dinuclear metal center YbgI/SA1388 family protein
MTDAKTMARILGEIAPYSLAAEGDNCGIILDAGRETSRVLFALDASPETIEEAAERGCAMLVAHHPAVYRPQNKFGAREPLVVAARLGVSLLAAHTCYDAAPGGVNDVLCSLLGLAETAGLGGGMGRVGVLERGMERGSFIKYVGGRLGARSLRAAAPDGGEIKRVAVVGGSGGNYVDDAIKAGCDALVTGEAGHHDGIAARSAGLCLVAAGHFATENPAVEPLRRAAQGKLGNAALCLLSEMCADPFVCF